MISLTMMWRSYIQVSKWTVIHWWHWTNSSQKNRQIWDVNDGVTLRHKAMQIKRLQTMKTTTPRLNNDFGITIDSTESFVKKKKLEREILAEEISQLIIRRSMLIENLKDYERYRQWSEYDIEVVINRISHKFGIKIEAYYGFQLNSVCVRRLMAGSEDIIYIYCGCWKV